MPKILPVRGRVAIAVGVAVALLITAAGVAAASAVPTLPAVAAPPAAAAAKPGSAGIGDRLFPRLGNGGYDVRSYDLALSYRTTNPKQAITGTVTIKATASQFLSRFNLDFAGASVGAVAVNGKRAAWSWKGGELVVTPGKPLSAGKAFTVKVSRFTAKPKAPNPDDLLSAPFFHTRDGSALAAQPDAAHLVFPSNDHPRDKATFTFTLDVPKGTTAVANGLLVSQKPAKAKGRTLWRYAQRQPMATELTQIAVGRFTVTSRGIRDGVQVRDVTPSRLTRTLAPHLAVEVAQLE